LGGYFLSARECHSFYLAYKRQEMVSGKRLTKLRLDRTLDASAILAYLHALAWRMQNPGGDAGGIIL
jgi:hypothetical protein